MGLDAYIYKVEGFKCPHCGEIIFDTDRAEEIAYYRKNWDFQHYINAIGIEYGDEQYDVKVEIPPDKLPKVIEFLDNQVKTEGYPSYYENLLKIKSMFYDAQLGKIKLYYDANW